MYPQFEGKTVVFVFGSNLPGYHGAGAALYARQHYGAIMYRGRGIQNRSYAIPTKDWDLRVLPLDRIKPFVDEFAEFALNYEIARPEIVFRLTAIGCGLAGYLPDQMAPMFKHCPPNCYYPVEWKHVLERLDAGLGSNRFISR